MSFLRRLSSADSQNFVCSQSELLGKLFVMAVATAAANRSCKALIAKAYPLPKFNIGDWVAEDWIDEFEKEVTDFGQVTGICYLPEEYFDCPAHTWVYFIHWIRPSSGLDSCYPCFDGQPKQADQLRLARHR